MAVIRYSESAGWNGGKMNFTINSTTTLCLDKNDWPGVIRVSEKVRGDMELVFGKCREVVLFDGAPAEADYAEGRVFAGCIGRSAVIDDLEKKGIIDLSAVRGKREMYLFTTVQINGVSAVVIAGSDKRGTIYGLFHISELMEVSPWVWFADVIPAKKECVQITEKDNMVSREPSVRYRGFFINDEWPSYGNWTTDNFGGFNAKMYDHVFELLLRMHGNYLWPAMWTSCFSEDGPGIENARLADEYGVVMGTSHHEPCMRHGEEFSHVKGPDSVYGNDWNFNRNRDGLINFWRDGLKRNAPFENVVTVGMRGEADSEMLGRECTTLDNINYLKDVITTQNGLLKEVYGEKASDVAKVFAVYKEVEKFYYGDEENEGLRCWDGLDGTIILLADDNHGYMRLLPPKEDRDHNGGFGMYYHLDYHGGPVSYEWVNSTHISRIAEQMGQAWDCGVRDLWIVNVGDLKPVEFPLNYFMDLAYDYDKWSKECNSYTGIWAKAQFGKEGAQAVSEAVNLLEDYTRISSARRPETIGPFTFNPVFYDESRKMLAKAGRVIASADAAIERYKGKDLYDAFFQLVYFPAKASMNVLTMQLYCGLDITLAKRGCPSANYFAEGIRQALELDEQLCDAYNGLGNGKWKGMMLSEHIGFVNWNEEEHRIPTRTYVQPYHKARISVSVTGLPVSTMGGDWTKRELLMLDLLSPGGKGQIAIENCCRDEALWEAETDDEWIVLSQKEGKIQGAADEDHLSDKGPDASVEYISVSADTELLHKACDAAGKRNITGVVKITSGKSKVFVRICARDFTEEEKKASFYVPFLPEEVNYPGSEIPLECAIEASDFEKLSGGKECDFKVFAPYGKYQSAMRAVPADACGEPEDMPQACYRVYIPEDGDYELSVCAAPGGPILRDTYASFGVSVNDGDVSILKMVSDTYRAGENSCSEWCKTVLEHERRQTLTFKGHKGENVIRIFGCDPGSVLTRLVIRQARGRKPETYFGPAPEYIMV